MKKRRILSILCAVSVACCVPVSAAETAMDSYERDGMKYIEKTYTIDAEDDISDVADGSFELDGYSYTQIDIKSEPVVQTEEKEVEEVKKGSVSGQSKSEILEKLGETLEYTDEDGFHGVLKPDLDSVKYYASGYTHKTMTKNGNQMYYNLSSMDTSQIPKSIWRDGIQLKLMDVQWIGDNRFASADTAVGNNFAAKGLYQGAYQVNIPSGYTAEVTYKGIVEKEISEQTVYTVTYVGEEIEPAGIFGEFSLPLMAGGLLFGAALIGAGVLLYKKLKNRSQTDWEDNEEGNMEDEVQENEK